MRLSTFANVDLKPTPGILNQSSCRARAREAGSAPRRAAVRGPVVVAMADPRPGVGAGRTARRREALGVVGVRHGTMTCGSVSL